MGVLRDGLSQSTWHRYSSQFFGLVIWSSGQEVLQKGGGGGGFGVNLEAVYPTIPVGFSISGWPPSSKDGMHVQRRSRFQVNM